MPTVPELLQSPVNHPVEAMIVQVQIRQVMESMTNEEVAALLVDHVESEMCVFDLQATIVSVAVDRLRST